MRISSVIATCGCAVLGLLGVPAAVLRLGWERLWPRKVRIPAGRRSLRIGYVLTEIGGGKPGGAASHKGGFCKGLLAAGHSPTVLACEPVPGLDRVVADYRILPAPVLPKAFPLTCCVLANNLIFTRQAYNFLKRSRPDVICHRHNQMNYAGAFLSRLLQVPFILEYNSPANWRGFAAEREGLLLTWLGRMIERVNLRAADRITVVSAVLKDHLVERGVAPEKVVVNPNGADAEMFRPGLEGGAVRQRLGLGGKIVVGFAGHHNSNNTWHGTRYLALAVRKVIAQRQDVQFLFIGDQGVIDLVAPILDAEGTRPFVTFAHSIPYPEMPLHYAACDILVSPHIQMADGSTFFGSPVKIFEYMAMGKAIVASSVGQLAELLEDRVNALLTRPGDSESIAQAILTLAGDEALRQRLGAAVRETCLRRCTWKHNAERFVQAYYDALEERTGGSQMSGVQPPARPLRGTVMNGK